MLGPDSRLLTALLVTVSVALLVGAIRLRLLPVKVVCGALSIMVAMTGGIAAVNYYYGYYTTWSQLWIDLHGSTGNLGTIASGKVSTSAVRSGRFGWVTLPGKLSGYSRPALMYLPPQYGEARYAHVRFPVLELFHGSPGTPLAWNTQLRISRVMDELLAEHLIGPMVLVMPSINGSGHNYQDCVNGPSLYDETYLTKDVRSDVLARYRVSRDSYEWGLGGYSSGGFCAANIALRHRADYGAAAVITGYFRAADGPAGNALHGSKTLEYANSPLYLAERLAPNTSPLPAFWVAAGTHDKADYKPATVFAEALNRIEQVPLIKLAAGDTENAWTAALPPALIWMWQQLAPPDLRVMFPTRGLTRYLATLPVSPAKRGHHLSSCKPSDLARATNRGCVSPTPGVTVAKPPLAKPPLAKPAV